MKRTLGFVLCGGKSSRFGEDKGVVNFQGKPMVEYAIELLSEVCDEVILNTNQKGYESFGLECIADTYQEIGPLGGIATILKQKKGYDRYICLPCDMPFLRSVDMAHFMDLKGEQMILAKDKQARLIPVVSSFLADIEPAVLTQIEKEDYKLQNLLKVIGYSTIELPNYTLRNINSKEDYEKE